MDRHRLSPRMALLLVLASAAAVTVAEYMRPGIAGVHTSVPVHDEPRETASRYSLQKR